MWSVLDAPESIRRGILPAGLRSTFEDDVPGDGTRLHAVLASLDDGRAIVCGIEASSLSELDPGVLSLTPGALPSCINATLDPAALNLLIGPFEPRPLRRARAVRHAVLAATLVLCAGLVSLGLLRRGNRWDLVANGASQAKAAALAGARVSDAITLGRELEQQKRASRPLEIDPAGGFEAGPALAGLLSAWPARVSSAPQSILIDSSGASMSVNIQGDPTAFLESFKPPKGWALEEPRLNTAGGVTRVNLALKRQEGRP
jgi:hypothetical protein